MSGRGNPVVIRDVELRQDEERRLLTANVDGDDLWFRFPVDFPIKPRAEAFLAPALFEAMVRGAPVVVEHDFPISARLLQGLSTIQSIFKCWNPDLHVVEVDAEAMVTKTELSGAVCCFSGGVDSTYTFACHRGQITHLLLLQGFDDWTRAEDWQPNVSARRRFAESENKTLVAVESNVRPFVEKRNIYWGLVIGGVLAGLGAAMAPATFLMPSSWTYQDLHAYGTHPLVDPLWSTEGTEVVHHGADITRSRKIEHIAEEQTLMEQLQVCWKSCASNCGNCPKCVRTSLVLYLIGRKSKNLPAYHSSAQLSLLKPYGEGSLPFVEDLILCCERNGAYNIRNKLMRMRRRYVMKSSAESFLKALTGSWGRRLDRKLRPREWHSARATLRSHDSPF